MNQLARRCGAVKRGHQWIEAAHPQRVDQPDLSRRAQLQQAQFGKESAFAQKFGVDADRLLRLPMRVQALQAPRLDRSKSRQASFIHVYNLELIMTESPCCDCKSIFRHRTLAANAGDLPASPLLLGLAACAAALTEVLGALLPAAARMTDSCCASCWRRLAPRLHLGGARARAAQRSAFCRRPSRLLGRRRARGNRFSIPWARSAHASARTSFASIPSGIDAGTSD